MLGKNPDVLPVKLYNNYIEMLNQVEVWKERFPNVELIYVEHSDLLKKPQESIKKVKDFLGEVLDESLMESAIDNTLYRNRK